MSVNAILSKCNFTNEIVKLQLLESSCLPILLYATECCNLSVAQLKEINSWWNSIYRKIFGYNKWESVKCVIYFLNRLDIFHLINIRQMKFLKGMSSGDCINKSIITVVKVFINSGKCLSIFNKYNCQFEWSIKKMIHNVYISFKNRVLTN